MVSELLRRAWSREYYSSYEEIDSEIISPEEASDLRQALLDAYYRASGKPDAHHFLDILAHGYEASIKEDLVRQLHLALEMQRAVGQLLWDTLRGLDDVGEEVFEPSEMGRGLALVEMNIEAAGRYLYKRGITVSW